MAIKDLTKSTDLVKELYDRGEAVRGLFAQRNAEYNRYEQMYNLSWETNVVNDPALQATKTIHPIPRNSCDGVVKLIEATDADFSVPFDKNAPNSQAESDAIETWCNTLFQMMGRTRGINLLHDMALSASVLNEIHIGITSTQLLLDQAKEKASKSNKMLAQTKRIERLALVIPYIWEIYDPRTGYPEFDSIGMSGYYRVVNNMRWSEILSMYGARAEEAGATSKNLQDKVEFSEWWDDVYHGTWVNGKVMMMQEHNLPRMPIIARVVGGTNALFSKPEYQRAGFLHTLDKSNLWSSMNIGMTGIVTSVLRTASMPQLIYDRMNGDVNDTVDIDYNQAGGVVYANRGSNLRPLDKKAIDPAMREFMSMADQQAVDSTIQGPALGQAIGASATYSMTSLLASQGRYVIVPIQRAIAEACGDAMATTLEFARIGLGTKMKANESVLQLDTKKIPEDTYVTCKIDVRQPSDDRQNALMAIQLTTPNQATGMPLTSIRYARENMLGMGQSKNMDQEIANEMVQGAMLNAQLQAELQKIQMQNQQQMQQGQPQGQPGMAPQGQPQQGALSPEEQMMMQQGGGGMAGSPGLPPTGPMPETGMAGGMA